MADKRMADRHINKVTACDGCDERTDELCTVQYSVEGETSQLCHTCYFAEVVIKAANRSISYKAGV